MRFRYHFQKIVDLKSNEKTQAEWILSQAIEKLREEESNLTDLENAKFGMQEELQKVSTNCTTVSNLMLLQSYVDHIEQRIQEKHLDLQSAKTVVQKRQEVLTDKMLEEKVWMKAKEKAYQKFSLQMLKKEQEELDEMVTNRYKKLS